MILFWAGIPQKQSVILSKIADHRNQINDFKKEQLENGMHYLLFYEVGEDCASRRAQYRDAHM